jgi:hypothetical protein
LAGFDPVRFIDNNGEYIKCSDGSDFYQAPHPGRLSVAMERYASQLPKEEWERLCDNRPESIKKVLEAAKNACYEKSDIPWSCRSATRFNIMGAGLSLMTRKEPPSNQPDDAGSYRPVSSFQPRVFLGTRDNPDESNLYEDLAGVWIQLDGTVRPPPQPREMISRSVPFLLP